MKRPPIGKRSLFLGGIALAAVLVVLWAWFETAGSGGEDPAGAAAAGPAGEASAEPAGPPNPGDAMPPMEATTPAEVRRVLAFSREATTSKIPALKRMALESGDPLVAGNAIRALGRLHALFPDPRLVKLIRDPRPRVRQEMVIALGRSGDPKAVDILIPLLEEGEANLGNLVIQALGRLGGPKAREVLERIAGGAARSETERVFARSALAAMDRPERVPLPPGNPQKRTPEGAEEGKTAAPAWEGRFPKG